MDVSNLNLTEHQKMVLLVVYTSSSPATAYNDMAANNKAVEATEMLSKAGALSKNDEDKLLRLTDAGKELMVNEKIISQTGDVTSYGKELLNKFVNESFSLLVDLNKNIDKTRLLSLREEICDHVSSGTGLFNNHYRLQSRMFTEFINEARNLFSEGKLIGLSKDDVELLNTDLGFFGEYEGQTVPLDLPMLDEAEYKGRDVELDKPMRSKGPKKFKVYTKNPETGNVIQVNFGAKKGSDGLDVKIDDPEARKNFAKRHKCETRDDKTKPSYWSCRLPRYAKQLGLSGGGSHWW